MSKKNISNFPFGKNTSSPDYFRGWCGDNRSQKKKKKKFVSNKKTYKENITQLSVKKNALNKGV
jgi:hypothetical protein